MKDKLFWASVPTIIIAIIVVIIMIIPHKRRNIVAVPTTINDNTKEFNDFVSYSENIDLSMDFEEGTMAETSNRESTTVETFTTEQSFERETTKRENIILYETVTKKTEERTEESQTIKEETITKKRDSYKPVILEELSEQLFKTFRHQTTNTLWNGTTTSKVMHPDQLLYLNELCEKWYEGSISVAQTKAMALSDSPVKTNEDMYNLTGFYQEFIGDEALFKIVDVDVAKVCFDGKRQVVSEEELWNALCDAGESSATANYLFVRACYNEIKDETYVYYFDCKFKWVNNNFVMEGEI